MERLINLRRLDIGDTPRLKMLLHPSKLKTLQVFLGAKFLLGGSIAGLRIGEFGELHNLYGSLSILELQNVADRREALMAKIGGKKHVEYLSMEWSFGSIANNSHEERDILDGLRPNTNIKELQITGYRGTKFPNWLADDRFNKLVGLWLCDCKDCDSLPALGQLPALKFLTIRGMHQIIEVTEELYGSPSSVKPFSSLERLEFAGMPEWNQWDLLGNGEFPALQYLSLYNCPKLTGKLPENLCFLTELVISKCPELILETPIQLSSVKKFQVTGSPRVGVLFDHAELFTSQQQGMKQIERLHLSDCQSLTSFPFRSLSNSLKQIRIDCCGKLKLEPPVSSIFLELLELEYCDSIDDISPELVPRARHLSVNRCGCLTRLLIPTGTEEVYIYQCENLEILLLACGIGTQMMSLRHLSIHNCKKLKSLPEHMHELLPSLKDLYLRERPEIESFPEGGLPFSLEVILKEGLPSSLSELSLYNRHELHSLPTEGLRHLTSLWCLEIEGCDQLQSIGESALPSSLSVLSISYCHNLQSLPVKGMPSSISKLYIEKFPLLEPHLEFEKGDYWPIIAHIPTIEICTCDD